MTNDLVMHPDDSDALNTLLAPLLKKKNDLRKTEPDIHWAMSSISEQVQHGIMIKLGVMKDYLAQYEAIQIEILMIVREFVPTKDKIPLVEAVAIQRARHEETYPKKS